MSVGVWECGSVGVWETSKTIEASEAVALRTFCPLSSVLCPPIPVPISYTVREGLAGFQRAKFAAFTATSALVVALVLIAVFGLLAWQAAQVTQWLKQRVGEVEVFVSDAADARATNALRLRLEATPGVEAVEFVSRE